MKTLRTVLPVCVLLIALCVGTAQAGATINFDDVPSQTVLAYDQYKAQGILLSTPGGNVWAISETEANTSPNICIGWDNYGFTPIIVDFVLAGTTTPGLTGIVSFYLMDADIGIGSTWKAEIFGVGNVLLDTKTGNTNDEIFISFPRMNQDIARMVFTPSDDFEGIDTLSHCEVVPVPEPTSLSVLALGALGLLFRRRR
jgi:hypothetical protein